MFISLKAKVCALTNYQDFNHRTSKYSIYFFNTLSIQPNGTTDKMHDASPESCVDGADIAVGFMLNSVVLYWQSVFEIGTSCKKNI